MSEPIRPRHIPRRRHLTALAAAGALAFAGLGALAAPATAAPHPAGAMTGRTAAAAPIVNISGACAGQNAEVEEATASPYVYQVWIGCGGIGFARSTDGGATYSSAVELPGSGGAWDPSIAVGPTGTVYAAFMLSAGGFDYPVVVASFDHGATFSQSTALRPSTSGNWGDRVFIAVAPDGTVYVTWDYGPSAATVKELCSSGGSCAFSAGELNSVIQKSTDGGLTFGPITPIGPGYPTMGGYSAPLLVDSTGRVDALYWGHQTDPGTYTLHPGYEYFTSSADGTTWPSSTVQVHPEVGSIALPTWWIDGDLAIDAGGTLYATWDTQVNSVDIGYLSWSADGGTTWSTPVRVTPDTDNAMHLVQVTGGPAGTAYVAWQTNVPSQGYATYLQTYTTAAGLIGSPAQISTAYGNPNVWPGDTFGLATLPGNQIALSWGSANGTSGTSEIYATVVPAADFGVTVNPASGSVVAGGQATTTVATTALGGDTETINLAATGLPAGATAVFNPATITAGGSSTLSIATAGSTPAGSYPVTITATGTLNTHSTTYTLTVTVPGGGVVNGGFETGTLSGWTASGPATGVTTSGPHTGSYAALLGSSSPTNGASNVAQTFTAPTGSTTLGFWYNVTCPDRIQHDWATATLKDNTTNSTVTVLAKTCVASSGWIHVSRAITAGHSYTLTLTSKDDNHAGDPTYTKYDDVTVS